jgi:hypothetical protein
VKPILTFLIANLLPAGLLAQTTTPQPAPIAAPGPPLDLSNYSITPFYSNDFSAPQKIVREEDLLEQAPDGSWRRKARPDATAVWIAEGTGGVEIRDGQLRVAPSPFDAQGHPTPVSTAQRSHMVVWNNKIFPGDFLLEFDMSPNGSTNGLTIVFLCATGKNGEDLFDLSMPPRRADYPTYHSGAIANYSDSYWSRNDDIEPLTNRLRKNPGFLEVANGPSLTIGPTNVTHHVRILKTGARLAVEMNGHVLYQWDDPKDPLGPGRIGFRSMQGVDFISYDNLKIWQIAQKSATAVPHHTKD